MVLIILPFHCIYLESLYLKIYSSVKVVMLLGAVTIINETGLCGLTVLLWGLLADLHVSLEYVYCLSKVFDIGVPWPLTSQPGLCGLPYNSTENTIKFKGQSRKVSVGLFVCNWRVHIFFRACAYFHYLSTFIISAVLRNVDVKIQWWPCCIMQHADNKL